MGLTKYLSLIVFKLLKCSQDITKYLANIHKYRRHREYTAYFYMCNKKILENSSFMPCLKK